MAVAIAVISVGKGSGASELTKYISERERHPEREGKARELFGQDVDGLKHKSADRYLTKGLSAEPHKKDVFHFVISPEAKQYERSGKTNKDRSESYKEAVRSTLKEVGREVGATDLRWVAAIHLNTKTPHIHVLVHKDFHDSDGVPRRFHRLPHLDTHKTDSEKLLHNRFESNLHNAITHERYRQEVRRATNWEYPSPHVSYEPKPEDTADRITLGKAMYSREVVAGRHKDLRTEQFTFDVKGKQVTTSEAEVHDAIKKTALQTTLWTYAKEGIPGLKKLSETTSAALKKVNATIEHIDDVTNRPFLASEKWVAAQEQKLANAILDSKPIGAIYSTAATLQEWYAFKSEGVLSAIEEKKKRFLETITSIGRPEMAEHYRNIREAEAILAAKPDIAAPIMDRETMNQLQDIYVRQGDVDGLKTLEEVRVTHAYENKIPTRTETEMAHLEGQHTVLQAMIATGQATIEQKETFKILNTIATAERERFLEQGIRVNPTASPAEQEFVDRVATVTGDSALMNRYFQMTSGNTTERVEFRTEIVSHHFPEMDLAVQEDIPVLETPDMPEWLMDAPIEMEPPPYIAEDFER